MANTKVKTYTADELAAAFLALLEGGSAAAPAKGKGKAKSEPEPDEDDDDEDADDDESVEKGSLDREEVEALGIKDLRALAVRAKLKEQKKKAEIYAELEKKGFFAAEDDDDDDDEDDDEDAVDLSEMSLKELRAYAKSEEGGEHTAAEVKGLDQDALIALIEGDDEDDDDDDDEDEDADDDDDDDDGEEELTEEDLKKMDLKGLKELAKELEIKVPAKLLKAASTDAKKRKVYVTAILATADDDE